MVGDQASPLTTLTPGETLMSQTRATIWSVCELWLPTCLPRQRHLEVGDKVNLKFGVDEDEGPHEDLNEREVSEEASVSSEGQQEFDESSDEEVEVSADDNNSQGQ